MALRSDVTPVQKVVQILGKWRVCWIPLQKINSLQKHPENIWKIWDLVGDLVYIYIHISWENFGGISNITISSHCGCPASGRVWWDHQRRRQQWRSRPLEFFRLRLLKLDSDSTEMTLSKTFILKVTNVERLSQWKRHQWITDFLLKEPDSPKIF